MVRGVERFKAHFAEYNDRYVLIGGAACSILLEEADLDFRATKDLDIVLCIEALDADFVRVFWEFIRSGKYQIQQKSSGASQLYRFKNPADTTFPVMLELFSRKPDLFDVADGSDLTPIPIDEDVSSLSAILLNDDYYRFITSGIAQVAGVPLVPAEYLIPLKAIAWLDLSKRKAEGTDIDSTDIKKHKNDVFRLYQLVSPATAVILPDSIRADMQRFIDTVTGEPHVDTKQLKIRATATDIINALKKIYALA